MRKIINTLMLGLALLASSNLFAEDGEPPEHIFPPQYTQEDLDCLYKVVYNETRGRESQGASLVVATVLNRTKSSRFPSTVCGVVYQKLQFTGIHKIHLGSITSPVKSVVHNALWLYEDGKLNKQVMFFHADYVYPKWAAVKKRVVKVGNHIFYRL